jgi:phosphoglycerate dehydrogenase-like enzyme
MYQHFDLYLDDADIPSAWFSTQDKQSLAEFYSKCKVLVNCLPSASETQNFVDAAAFKAMPSDGVFVNIGRGDTVDQDALIHALQESTAESDRIGAAALDVTNPEPLPANSKLWGLKNVLITPHVSGASDQYWVRGMDLMGINVLRVLQEGKGALNAVRGKREDD